MFSPKKNSNLIYFVLIILIGIFLRAYQLNFENYWLDEMISYWVADPNISHNEALIRREQLGATSPVLFDLILRKYLTFFSYEPEYGRHVPLIFGALSIPLLGILSHQISKNNSYLLERFNIWSKVI